MSERPLVGAGVAVVAFLLQLLGYAALVGASAHGEVTALVGLVRRLPTVVALSLGVFAVPALVVTLAVGAVVGLFGGSLQGVGVGLVTESDLPFLVDAACLSATLGRRAAGTAR